MRFGPNAEQVTVLRRAPNAAGQLVGDFADVFSTWAKWTQNPGHLAAVGGQREDPIDLVLAINDWPRNRTVSNADRIRAGGQVYEVVSVGLPERKSGSISIVLQRIVNG